MRRLPREAMRPVELPEDEQTFQDINRETASAIADEVRRTIGSGLTQRQRRTVDLGEPVVTDDGGGYNPW